MAISPGRGAVPAAVQNGVVLPSRIQGSQVGANQTGSPLVPATVAIGRAARPAVSILVPGPALRRQQTDDRQANASAEAARTSTSQAKANAKGLSQLIEGIALISGTNVVTHGLGRHFRGVALMSPSASVNWYIQRPSGIAADGYQITITVSTNVTVDLEVWA
jgi:hypothetical protein